jgi:hypothetical protein
MVAGLQRAFSTGGDRAVSHIVGIWEEVGVGGGGGAGGGQKRSSDDADMLVWCSDTVPIFGFSGGPERPLTRCSGCRGRRML